MIYVSLLHQAEEVGVYYNNAVWYDFLGIVCVVDNLHGQVVPGSVFPIG